MGVNHEKRDWRRRMMMMIISAVGRARGGLLWKR